MSTDRTIRQHECEETRATVDEAAHDAWDSVPEWIDENPDHMTDANLLDVALVYVEQETWNFFVNVLDQPPENAGFVRSMQARVPWNQ